MLLIFTPYQGKKPKKIALFFLTKIAKKCYNNQRKWGRANAPDREKNFSYNTSDFRFGI